MCAKQFSGSQETRQIFSTVALLDRPINNKWEYPVLSVLLVFRFVFWILDILVLMCLYQGIVQVSSSLVMYDI